jgi:hypothetical protein
MSVSLFNLTPVENARQRYRELRRLNIPERSASAAIFSLRRWSNLINTGGALERPTPEKR